GRTNCCTKQDGFAIRGPDRGRSSMLHESELSCLAAIGWNEPDLCFFLATLLLIFAVFTRRFALSIRDKGKPAAIGRPTWTMSIGWSRREAPGFSTISRGYPDGRVILMFVFIDSGCDKGNA